MIKPPIRFNFTWSPVAFPVAWTANGNSYPYAGHRFRAYQTYSDTPIRFQANVVFYSGITPLEYRWDFGDGEVDLGDVVFHTYKTSSPETRVALHVTDSKRNTWHVSSLLNLRLAP